MATARNLKLVPDPEPRVVPLAEIQDQPVKEDTHFDTLANSIQQLGVLQPPILREPKTKTGKYEIIAGRRRLAVALRLGIDPVICVVYPKSVDKAFIPSAAIAENAVRSKNIGSDIVAMQLLVDQGYDDPEVVSSMTGLPEAEVKRLFELRDLPKPVLDGIVGGVISTTTAGEVRKLRPQAMERAIKVLGDTGKLTSNDIRKVREVQIDQAASQVVLPTIPDLPDLEDDLITSKGDFLAVLDGVILILESEDTNDSKIERLRSLVGLPPSGATEAAVATQRSADQPTIAQRARRSKTTGPVALGGAK